MILRHKTLSLAFWGAIAWLGMALTPVALKAQSTAENRALLPKVTHAEPLFIDLIRDLGARQGEKEWNVGMGMTDRLRHDSYNFLVEYEWAHRDRWGLEIEVPVTVYLPVANGGLDLPPAPAPPSNRIESLKLASQYTFLVSERHQASMAFGGIVELELFDLNRIRLDRPLQGILYNPFFIAAKRWGDSWHTLLYTGPRLTQHFFEPKWDWAYEVNTSVHYMIPGTRNFVGLETNQLWSQGRLTTILRPQMRLVINEGLMVGVVPGIPVSRERERLSAFLRLIYEPGHPH